MDVRMAIAAWPADAPRGAVTAFCRSKGMSRSRFYELRAIAARQGPLAVIAPPPRSRPDLATSPALEEAAVRVRKELADEGWCCGPVTVQHRLRDQGYPTPSRATLARIFTRRGLVNPAPAKRPHASYRRFTFALVHECWQLDGTEVALADGGTGWVLQLLDDHSRYLLGSAVDHAETGRAAIAVFTAAVAAHQAPQILLTDNAKAFNQHRIGRTAPLQARAQAIGTLPVSSRVRHPQTLGKNERIHQTFKHWLTARPVPANLAELHALAEQFQDEYNHHRHQGLDLATPAEVLTTAAAARPPAPPPPAPAPKATTTRSSMSTHRVHRTGIVCVRHAHINLGTEHAYGTVVVVTEGDQVAIFDQRGTLLRAVDLEPGRAYYGNGLPTNPRRKRPPDPD